jgi:hypothetical protein
VAPRPRAEPSRPVTLESLSTEPPAGPTVMQRTHEHAMRRVVKLTKNWFKRPDQAEERMKAALVLYLREWVATYRQGVAETHISAVDRTILSIRQDTVVQIMSEIARQDIERGTEVELLTGSAHGTGTTGDRPPDGVPPADF